MPDLFTIGHSAHPGEKFLELLRQHRVELWLRRRVAGWCRRRLVKKFKLAEGELFHAADEVAVEAYRRQGEKIAHVKDAVR